MPITSAPRAAMAAVSLPVPAAEIDDPLARLGRKQIDHVRGEGGDETERAVVEPCVPGRLAA